MATVFLVLGLVSLSSTAMVSITDFSRLESDRAIAEFIADIEVRRVNDVVLAEDDAGALDVVAVLASEGWTGGAAGECPAGAGMWAEARRFDGMAPEQVCMSSVARAVPGAGCGVTLTWFVRRPGRRLIVAPWGRAVRVVQLPSEVSC